VIKIRSQFDYQKGDSGSAETPGEKCVIIWALNLDTKIDQNRCHRLKINKNDQNSTKHKNRKNTKIIKSEKRQKAENQKSSKVTKCKSEKVTKKCQKSTPPEKGQNVT